MSFAWTRVVGKANTSCPNPQYSTITDAVNHAVSGDVINICPALYDEQVTITKPLTLRGISLTDTALSPPVDVDRVLIQPSSLKTSSEANGTTVEAVITVMNTAGVTIENLAIDASKSSVSGCTPQLADIHFYNASGGVRKNALFGAELTNPQGCASSPFPGNGFGVLVDSSQPGPYRVSVEFNSIHDFTKDGVQAINAGVTVDITGNSINGIGPNVPLQFGVFLANGAAGVVKGNVITEGLCGTLSATDCVNARSEGITLRAVGDRVVLEDNVINDAQSGIFINGGNRMQIRHNFISNVGPLNGIDIQGTASGSFSNSQIDGNVIFSAVPVGNESCGIAEYSGTGVSGNTISNTVVNDAYCGVLFVTADHVQGGSYFNTLYPELNGDLYPTVAPPPVEP
jgi:nitrous oxidase accessory protein NosD